ncbi:MAG: hypothetical protein N2486_08940 [Caloramator sp.]|nr:hypothetical protein [Caloramator sp.]
MGNTEDTENRIYGKYYFIKKYLNCKVSEGVVAKIKQIRTVPIKKAASWQLIS